MDDYVSKPIDVDVLAAVLEKWLPKCSNPPSDLLLVEKLTQEQEKVESMTENCPIEMSRMLDLFDGDEEIIEELLSVFYDSLVPLKIKLAEVVSNRTTTVNAVAHEIKGSAYNVGAVKLGDLAQKLEIAGQQQNWSEIDTLTEHIQIELDCIKQFIERRC